MEGLEVGSVGSSLAWRDACAPLTLPNRGNFSTTLTLNLTLTLMLTRFHMFPEVLIWCRNFSFPDLPRLLRCGFGFPLLNPKSRCKLLGRPRIRRRLSCSVDGYLPPPNYRPFCGNAPKIQYSNCNRLNVRLPKWLMHFALLP